MSHLETEFPRPKAEEYHIQLHPGDMPKGVLLPGSPQRVDLVLDVLEEGACLKYNREFRSARGRYQGTEIGCVSTGIGTTSAEICIHELCNIGVETAIRIGTTGSISPRFAPGDLIIPVAAIRADGTSDCYIDRSFPAVANLDVVNALGEACEHLGFRYGYGIMYSPSSLYIGQGRKLSEQGYWPSSAQHLIDDLRQARVTNIDTDSAGQFVVGYLHNMRMASILSVITNRLDNTWSTDDSSERRACRAACEDWQRLFSLCRGRAVVIGTAAPIFRQGIFLAVFPLPGAVSMVLAVLAAPQGPRASWARLEQQARWRAPYCVWPGACLSRCGPLPSGRRPSFFPFAPAPRGEQAKAADSLPKRDRKAAHRAVPVTTKEVTGIDSKA